MGKKKKNKALPQQLRNLRAASAAAARSTAGRSRVFDDAKDAENADDGSDEISDGLAEYEERKKP